MTWQDEQYNPIESENYAELRNWTPQDMPEGQLAPAVEPGGHIFDLIRRAATAMIPHGPELGPAWANADIKSWLDRGGEGPALSPEVQQQMLDTAMGWAGNTAGPVAFKNRPFLKQMIQDAIAKITGSERMAGQWGKAVAQDVPFPGERATRLYHDITGTPPVAVAPEIEGFAKHPYTDVPAHIPETWDAFPEVALGESAQPVTPEGNFTKKMFPVEVAPNKEGILRTVEDRTKFEKEIGQEILGPEGEMRAAGGGHMNFSDPIMNDPDKSRFYFPNLMDVHLKWEPYEYPTRPKSKGSPFREYVTPALDQMLSLPRSWWDRLWVSPKKGFGFNPEAVKDPFDVFAEGTGKYYPGKLTNSLNLVTAHPGTEEFLPELVRGEFRHAYGSGESATPWVENMLVAQAKNDLAKHQMTSGDPNPFAGGRDAYVMESLWPYLKERMRDIRSARKQMWDPSVDLNPDFYLPLLEPWAYGPSRNMQTWQDSRGRIHVDFTGRKVKNQADISGWREEKAARDVTPSRDLEEGPVPDLVRASRDLHGWLAQPDNANMIIGRPDPIDILSRLRDQGLLPPTTDQMTPMEMGRILGLAQ